MLKQACSMFLQERSVSVGVFRLGFIHIFAVWKMNESFLHFQQTSIIQEFLMISVCLNNNSWPYQLTHSWGETQEVGKEHQWHPPTQTQQVNRPVRSAISSQVVMLARTVTTHSTINTENLRPTKWFTARNPITPSFPFLMALSKCQHLYKR